MRLENRYFGLRHGESEANAAGIIISDPLRGCAAWGLTPRGRDQVRASVLAASPPLSPRTLIFSSDLLRARETAETARASLSSLSAVRLRPALRERSFGRHEGGPNTAYEPVWARDRADPDHTDGDVESARSVADRTWHLVLDLESHLSDETVLLVAHGDPLQLLATRFLARSPSTHRDMPPWLPGEVRLLG